MVWLAKVRVGAGVGEREGRRKWGVAMGGGACNFPRTPPFPC